MAAVALSAALLSVPRPQLFLALVAIFSFYLAFTVYRVLYRKTSRQRAHTLAWGAFERAAEVSRRGYELGLGIGIAMGYATLGRIGFEGRYDYGMVGTAVILASRLSSEAKPGQILLTQRVHAAVDDLVVAEPVGALPLKGFSRPVPAVNVLALAPKPPEQAVDARGADAADGAARP